MSRVSAHYMYGTGIFIEAHVVTDSLIATSDREWGMQWSRVFLCPAYGPDVSQF